VVLAFAFFLVLRFWGIDLPLGRLFTEKVLSVIVMVVLGVIAWEVVKARIDRKLKEDSLTRDEGEGEEGGGPGGSRSATLLLLLRKFILAVLFVVVALITLSSIGVDIAPLIAGAGVVGLAIGFGSQTLVKDIIAGLFFLSDDAFRIGDYVEAGAAKGTVVHMSLRSLKLRHPRGMLYTVPFGDLKTVTNFSRDYIITKLDVRVRFDADLEKVRKIIKKINKEIMQDEENRAALLSDIKSTGVREIDDSAMIVRIKFKTIPGKQFILRREIFARLQKAFHASGIEFAHRNVTVYIPPIAHEGETPEQARQRIEAAAGGAAAAAIAQAEAEALAQAKPEKK
jgi:small-conductance mechanosensitive channel